MMHARARIKLFPTENGGRAGPTPSHFFNFLCRIDGKNYDCRMMLADNGSIRPGDTAEDIPLVFLFWDAVKPKIQKDTSFEICDGFKVVGEGLINSVDS